MQQQQQPTPTDEEWYQLMQLFRRAEQSSATTAEELQNEDEQEMADSDQDPENLDSIWTSSVQGVDIFDSQEGQDLRQEPESGQQVQSQNTSGGVIGSSSLHHQVIDPQGNIITNQESHVSSSVPQCAGCGMTSTPEWRRGPTGPRTLCNACGLTYAKILRARATRTEETSTSNSDGDGGSDSSGNQEDDDD